VKSISARLIVQETMAKLMSTLQYPGQLIHEVSWATNWNVPNPLTKSSAKNLHGPLRNTLSPRMRFKKTGPCDHRQLDRLGAKPCSGTLFKPGSATMNAYARRGRRDAIDGPEIE